MGIVAILATRPGPFEQNFNLPLPGCCIWNLIENDPEFSKEKSLERLTTSTTDHSGELKTETYGSIYFSYRMSI